MQGHALSLQTMSMTNDGALAHYQFLIARRLLLRQIQPKDADALVATFLDEDAMRCYAHEPHQSLVETRHLIEQIQVRYAWRVAIHWGITL